MHTMYTMQTKQRIQTTWTTTIKTPSYMDVAPWCYKWDWMDWISPGGVRYRGPYSANKTYEHK